ncbi:PorT family protein [Mucilaginibacter sp. ZT4R22]|uniref:PorT family protein n=1 Tax=Mucilaginibacter pankratovii TaxID=2772110 RepID=A0ABR7WSK1_9SPHI|nr:outer membrane beta-barrel protein [Mucilaginibacter pankratovii]MBD1365163.1 PorT family protein [Mucilaginibacter pankratovii]
MANALKGFLILLICLFINSSTSNAQVSLGVEGGFSLNHLFTKMIGYNSTKNVTKLGATTGLIIQYKLTDNTFIETTPGFVSKKYSFARTGLLKGAFLSFENNYLQLPVTLNFVFGNKLKFFLGPGIYTAYWLSGSEYGNIPDIFSASQQADDTSDTLTLVYFKKSHRFDPTLDNRWEFGVSASCGLRYPLNEKYKIGLSVKYYQALTSRYKVNTANTYTNYNGTGTACLSLIYSLN